MINTESLPSTARTELLAQIAYELTICARDTYEVGTDKVLEPELLRLYNELQHRVAGAIVQHLLGTDGNSLESILEMIRTFGTQQNRVNQIDWALNRALQQTR
jgi:hypothetical protein